MAPEDNVAAKVRLSAMNLLARREYSRAELEQKLSTKYADCKGLVPGVLDRLAEQGLQSDERYVLSFCRARISRGQGRQRIINELRQRGIDSIMAESVLDGLEVDWFELASDVARRRFHNKQAENPRDIIKRMRFLQYRGFNQDQIRYAMECLGGD